MQDSDGPHRLVTAIEKLADNPVGALVGAVVTLLTVSLTAASFAYKVAQDQSAAAIQDRDMRIQQLQDQIDTLTAQNALLTRRGIEIDEAPAAVTTSPSDGDRIPTEFLVHGIFKTSPPIKDCGSCISTTNCSIQNMWSQCRNRPTGVDLPRDLPQRQRREWKRILIRRGGREE